MIARAAQFVRHTSRMAAGLSDPTAATMSSAATVAIGTFSMALPKSSRTTATITPAYTFAQRERAPELTFSAEAETDPPDGHALEEAHGGVGDALSGEVA